MSKYKFDYIIPICNTGPDFHNRLSHINLLRKKLPSFVNLIVVEQLTDAIQYPFSSEGKYEKININYKTFSKGWCFNVGVNNSETNHIILAEADLMVPNDYFHSLLDYISKHKHVEETWCFGWYTIEYLNKEGLIEKMRYPKPGGPEGGLIYIHKNFYNNIGRSNEFMESLGGVDNEMARRMQFKSDHYLKAPLTIQHMWHPDAKDKQDGWKHNKHRKKNVEIYNISKTTPRKLIGFLSTLEAGSVYGPQCKFHDFDSKYKEYKGTYYG